MEITLAMSSRFGGPPKYWLDMTIDELFLWVERAEQMIAREKRKRNFQLIGR